MKKRITGINQNGNLNNSNNPTKPNPLPKTENIQTSIFNQINQEKQKNRDIILKSKYSAALKSSAENFLIDLFEKISTLNDFDNVDIEIPISAAMAIISNISWHQPTEAQVEYDFTRECMDNGLYAIQVLGDDDLNIEDEKIKIDDNNTDDENNTDKEDGEGKEEK